MTHSRIACGAHCLTIPLRLTIPPRPRVPYVSCAPAWPRVVAHCTGRVLDTQHVRGASTKVSELVNCSRLALVERQVQVYLRRKGLRTKRCCTFPGFLFFEGLEGAPMGPGNDHSSSRSSLSGTLRLAPSSCRAGASQPRRATEVSRYFAGHYMVSMCPSPAVRSVLCCSCPLGQLPQDVGAATRRAVAR